VAVMVIGVEIVILLLLNFAGLDAPPRIRP
jgi:hypothetical protein